MNEDVANFGYRGIALSLTVVLDDRIAEEKVAVGECMHPDLGITS